MPTLEMPAIPAPPVPTLTMSRIVLVGFMGAGKSTVGRMLADQLGWQFMDTDTCIEQRCGCSIAALFATQGEAGFRQRESLELARALGQDHAVIAVGGGAPEVLTNRLLLEQTPGTAVVFLQAPFSVLFDRCVLQEGVAVRPVLQDLDAAVLRFRARLPIYQRCAHYNVATGLLNASETVERILELIKTRPDHTE